jgi:hypothetical protein
MPEIMIFKAGKYPQGDWPKERVQRLVEAYDPEKNLAAPAVIGHRFYSDTDESQYAHGWIRCLRMDGAGKVYADIPEFSVEAKRAIAESKLRYVSAEIYEYDKADPTAAPYLRAVALLGRDSPQIPAAKLPALFGVFEIGSALSVNEEEHIAAFTRRADAGDIKALSAREGGEIQEENGLDKEKEVEELRADLAKAREEIALFRKENSDLKAAGGKQDAEAYFGKLRDEGKIAPAFFGKAAELDARLGEGERKDFRALFSSLEPKVDLSGSHVADKKNAGGAAGGVTLGARIRAFQAEKGIASFGEAADALYAEKPEYFKEGETE